MNSAITFASFVCLLWLTGVVLKLPSGTVPLTLKIYLLLHIVFLLAGWLANQQWSWYDQNYVRIYTAVVIPVFVCAVILTLQVCSGEGLVPLGTACVFMAAAIFTVSWKAFPHPAGDPRQTYLFRLLGLFVGVFVACGITLFLSIASNEGAVWEQVKITMGAFWLIEGMVHWVWGCLMARGETRKAMELHEWAPPLIAVFLFFYLAWSLSQAHVVTSNVQTSFLPNRVDAPVIERRSN